MSKKEIEDLINLYTFNKIMAHLTSIALGSKIEKRNRERRRVRIALRKIKEWEKEGRELYKNL